MVNIYGLLKEFLKVPEGQYPEIFSRIFKST